MKATRWVLLATVLVGALALTSGISAKDKPPQAGGNPQTPAEPVLPAPAANDTPPADSSSDAIDSGGAIEPFAPGGGHGGGGGSHVRTLGKHICSVIGGTWDRTTSTCEISADGTASTSFLIAEGSLLLIDEGASLTVTAGTTIVDDGFNVGGIANDGTLNNSGTISAVATSNPGAYFVNGSTGTVNNDGTFDFSNQGYVRNSGTLDNSSNFTTWNLDNYGSVSNEGTFFVNDAFFVATGAVVDNAGFALMDVQGNLYIQAGGTINNAQDAILTSENGATISFEVDGTLDNSGLVSNEGAAVIYGTVINESGSNINNFLSIDNFGTVTNGGTITNTTTVTNDCATFTNETGSTYTGSAPVTDCT